jgi:hypothetical protein
VHQRHLGYCLVQTIRLNHKDKVDTLIWSIRENSWEHTAACLFDSWQTLNKDETSENVKITKAGLETALSLLTPQNPELKTDTIAQCSPTSDSDLLFDVAPKSPSSVGQPQSSNMSHAVVQTPDEKAEIDDGPGTLKNSYDERAPNWLPSCYGEVNLDLLPGLMASDLMSGQTPWSWPLSDWVTPTRSWDSTYENLGLLEHRGSTWDGAVSHNSVITEHGFPRS